MRSTASSRKQMFRGTVTQTSVYPREVVKEAMGCNAAAVILAHNHPSGAAEPSRADEVLTQPLKAALRSWTCGGASLWKVAATMVGAEEDFTAILRAVEHPHHTAVRDGG